MTKKIGDKKIGGVQSTTETRGVGATSGVEGVGGVKSITGIGGVGSTSRVGRRRTTKILSAADREHLFKMINEEAEKLFGASGMSSGERTVLADAVKMSIDAGIVDEDE